MNEHINVPLHALPDGEAELRLVVRLQWADVAALGQEAGRLAAQMQRPVSLDEAVSHRLRTRTATHAKATPERTQPVTQSSVSSLTARTPGENARQAIEKINGTAGPEYGTTHTHTSA
ncbi:hypothetical protein OG883_36875 [Streptomyces sp. NBC_01142]|uniref:hypothetical protein n=1 Tax=Streptomyces sp. NBC_01142 TaxID=2975865 RepID=UPI002258CF6D|nr:hypothetical protein [Streptomyces sp. NBC_01142]MCX4825333.1 hypothetical protein [Streptomyces sp. NBC_01142]